MRTASASGISCFIVFTVGVLAVAESVGPTGAPEIPACLDGAKPRSRTARLRRAATRRPSRSSAPCLASRCTGTSTRFRIARRPRRNEVLGTVVEGHGKQWLFRIAEQTWRPDGGERVATIGPLVVDSGVPHTARYLETVIRAGFQDGAIRRPKHGSARCRQVRCSGISTRIRAALPQRPPAGREERSPSRSASTGFLPSRRRAGVQTVVSGSRSSGRSS